MAAGWSSWEKAVAWLLSWTNCFFMEHFSLKNDWPTNDGLSDLAVWQNFSQRWTKGACFFKEYNWQHLWPMIKSELSDFTDFRNLYMVSLATSQYLNIFFDQISGNINESAVESGSRRPSSRGQALGICNSSPAGFCAEQKKSKTL